MHIHRNMLAAAALGAALLLPPGHGAAEGQTQFVFQSASIDMPAGDRQYPGAPGDAGAEAMNGNCVGCHSAGMVLNQPALTRTAWEGEVSKMINVYKAPVAAADVPAIIGYLDSTKGTTAAGGAAQGR